MAVGMMLVGRLIRHPEADEGQDGPGGIGQVVQGICHDGHGPSQGSHQQLHGKQQQIAADAHPAGQAANGAADPGILQILMILHKKAKQ